MYGIVRTTCFFPILVQMLKPVRRKVTTLRVSKSGSVKSSTGVLYKSKKIEENLTKESPSGSQLKPLQDICERGISSHEDGDMNSDFKYDENIDGT